MVMVRVMVGLLLGPTRGVKGGHFTRFIIGPPTHSVDCRGDQ